MNKLAKIKLVWLSSYKINKIREKIRSLLFPYVNTKVIFIFGCQRSGTTIIQRLISLSTNVKFYGEGDPPYFHDPESEKHHRIKSTAEINTYLKHESLDYIVIKPLYESQNANELINSNQNSKGIWVFRNYLDVIDSHLHYYNYDVKIYVAPIFDYKKNSWLNESVPSEIQKFIIQFNLNEISDADAYGLFWIVRNSLYLNIKNKNILLVNYETLVTSPSTQISRFCNFLGLPYFGFYSNVIRTNAISKKVNFTLNPIIEDKCKNVYQKLLELC